MGQAGQAACAVACQASSMPCPPTVACQRSSMHAPCQYPPRPPASTDGANPGVPIPRQLLPLQQAQKWWGMLAGSTEEQAERKGGARSPAKKLAGGLDAVGKAAGQGAQAGMRANQAPHSCPPSLACAPFRSPSLSTGTEPGSAGRCTCAWRHEGHVGRQSCRMKHRPGCAGLPMSRQRQRQPAGACSASKQRPRSGRPTARRSAS